MKTGNSLKLLFDMPFILTTLPLYVPLRRPSPSLDGVTVGSLINSSSLRFLWNSSELLGVAGTESYFWHALYFFTKTSLLLL